MRLFWKKKKLIVKDMRKMSDKTNRKAQKKAVRKFINEIGFYIKKEASNGRYSFETKIKMYSDGYFWEKYVAVRYMRRYTDFDIDVKETTDEYENDGDPVIWMKIVW